MVCAPLNILSCACASLWLADAAEVAAWIQQKYAQKSDQTCPHPQSLVIALGLVDGSAAYGKLLCYVAPKLRRRVKKQKTS